MIVYVFFCPRCDKKYESENSAAEVQEEVKTHVRGQHPDHDPNWFDTYPEYEKEKREPRRSTLGV